MRRRSQVAGSVHDAIAHRGYLIRPRSDSGYSITAGVHVIQHQTPTVESAKSIIDQLID